MDGKRRQKTKAGFRTRREAQAALTTALDSLGKGTFVDAGRLTVGDFLQEWLHGKAQLRPTTRASYESHLRLYLVPSLGRLRLSEVRHREVQRVFVELREAGLSPVNLRRVHATLRSAFTDAVRHGVLAVNPALYIELPAVPKRALAVWTHDQLAAFLRAIEGDRHAPLYTLAAGTGLRRGELAGLRWKDVDLVLGELRIRQQLVKAGRETYFSEPKTKAGYRTVSLDRASVQMLARHKDDQALECLVREEAFTPDRTVFTREDGRPLRPEYVYKRFLRLSRDLGLPVIRLHDLRHTHASHALAAGVAMKIVQERLGHSSMALTADTYTHVLPQVHADAAELMAKVQAAANSAALARREHEAPESTS